MSKTGEFRVTSLEKNLRAARKARETTTSGGQKSLEEIEEAIKDWDNRQKARWQDPGTESE